MKLPPKGADRDAFLARVAADYTAGRTLMQMAVEHRVSFGTIAEWLRLANCPRRRKGAPRGPRDRERVARAVALYAQGATPTEIVAEVGTPVSTMRRWSRVAGVPPHATGRPRAGSTASTRALRDRALDLHAQGVAHKMIASNLGRHVATVNRWCTEADRERVVRIREMFAQGMERADIAALFSTSVAFVTLVTAPAWRAA